MEVLTEALAVWIPTGSLAVESQAVMQTLNGDYYNADNKLGVSCVQ